VVLWVGGDRTTRLAGACSTCRLQLKTVEPDAVRAAAPAAKALVLEVPDDPARFLSWAAPVVDTALDHGLAVGLVMEEADDSLPFAPDLGLYERYYRAGEALKAGRSERVQLFFNDPRRVAHWVSSWNPGPGENAGTRIEGAPVTDVATQVLLRRVFQDQERIVVTPLSGGKSGAGVWRIEAHGGGRTARSESLVVKVHELAKMQAERSNYELIRSAVSPRLHAPLDRERCAGATSWGSPHTAWWPTHGLCGPNSRRGFRRHSSPHSLRAPWGGTWRAAGAPPDRWPTSSAATS
jgi:hypothetical protein